MESAARAAFWGFPAKVDENRYLQNLDDSCMTWLSLIVTMYLFGWSVVTARDFHDFASFGMVFIFWMPICLLCAYCMYKRWCQSKPSSLLVVSWFYGALNLHWVPGFAPKILKGLLSGRRTLAVNAGVIVLALGLPLPLHQQIMIRLVAESLQVMVLAIMAATNGDGAIPMHHIIQRFMMRMVAASAVCFLSDFLRRISFIRLMARQRSSQDQDPCVKDKTAGSMGTSSQLHAHSTARLISKSRQGLQGSGNQVTQGNPGPRYATLAAGAKKATPDVNSGGTCFEGHGNILATITPEKASLAQPPQQQAVDGMHCGAPARYDLPFTSRSISSCSRSLGSFNIAQGLITQDPSRLLYRSETSLHRVAFKIPGCQPADMPAGWQAPFSSLCSSTGLHLRGSFIREGCVHLLLELAQLNASEQGVLNFLASLSPQQWVQLLGQEALTADREVLVQLHVHQPAAWRDAAVLSVQGEVPMWTAGWQLGQEAVAGDTRLLVQMNLREEYGGERGVAVSGAGVAEGTDQALPAAAAARQLLGLSRPQAGTSEQLSASPAREAHHDVHTHASCLAPQGPEAVPAMSSAWLVQLSSDPSQPSTVRQDTDFSSAPDLLWVSPPCLLLQAQQQQQQLAAAADAGSWLLHAAAAHVHGSSGSGSGGPTRCWVRYKGQYLSCTSSVYADCMSEQLPPDLAQGCTGHCDVMRLEVAAGGGSLTPGLMQVECQRGNGLLGAPKPVLVVSDSGVHEEICALVWLLAGNPSQMDGLVRDLGMWLDAIHDVKAASTQQQQVDGMAAAESPAAAALRSWSAATGDGVCAQADACVADLPPAASLSDTSMTSAAGSLSRPQQLPPDLAVNTQQDTGVAAWSVRTGTMLLVYAIRQGWPHTTSMLMSGLVEGLGCSVQQLHHQAVLLEGLGLLHLAVRSSSEQLVELMLELGGRYNYQWDPVAVGIAGLTPLHLAAVLPDQGGSTIACCLLRALPGAAEAWFGATCDDGATPQSLALQAGNHLPGALAEQLLQQLPHAAAASAQLLQGQSPAAEDGDLPPNGLAEQNCKQQQQEDGTGPVPADSELPEHQDLGSMVQPIEQQLTRRQHLLDLSLGQEACTRVKSSENCSLFLLGGLLSRDASGIASSSFSSGWSELEAVSRQGSAAGPQALPPAVRQQWEALFFQGGMQAPSSSLLKDSAQRVALPQPLYSGEPCSKVQGQAGMQNAGSPCNQEVAASLPGPVWFCLQLVCFLGSCLGSAATTTGTWVWNGFVHAFDAICRPMGARRASSKLKLD